MRTHSLLFTLVVSCGAGADAGPEAAGAPVRTDSVTAPSSNTHALVCDVAREPAPLPRDVPETSGLAWSGRDPALFWTHNDAGNDADLFAIRADGRLAGRIRVSGVTAVDWEDVETAPCGDRWCLYVGDIGDNDDERDHITIYRLPEPAEGAVTATAEALHARFPDGPRDTEALFVRGGEIYVVTKGRRHDIELFHWPASGSSSEVAVLQPVRLLGRRPGNEDDRVTAATASPDGSWIAVRSYRTLYLYPAADLTSGAAVRALTYDLAPLGEPQGEGLVLLDDGTVWLTSEGGGGRGPSWVQLQCQLPDGPG